MTTEMEKAKKLIRLGICCIRLSHGYVVWVDPDDWVSLPRKGWVATGLPAKVYAYKHFRFKNKRGHIRMHCVIAKTPKGMICHHKNHNTLDNRKFNLVNIPPHVHSRPPKRGGMYKTNFATLLRALKGDGRTLFDQGKNKREN